MENTKLNYKPERCEHCKQTTTYLIPVDKGASVIMVAISAAIRRKGINAVHVVKEMMIPTKEWNMDAARAGFVTVNHIRNLARVRIHGLIAAVKGERGNFCLTHKGAQYLKNVPVAKYAIRSKAEHKTIGYFEPEKYTTTISQELRKVGNWEGIDFDIVDGRILIDPPVKPKVEASGPGTQSLL